jgi:redox-sensitive bicupin YhaK (pirin superfamily)
VEHADSLGNAGAIEAGDVQWMTAGSGIVHQEMPKRSETALQGFQLWVNLPGKQKMSTPAYRGLQAGEFPVETTDAGARVRVVAGQYGSVQGPVQGIPVDPSYFDITLPPNGHFDHPFPEGHNVFAHTVTGEISYGPLGGAVSKRGETVLFGMGDGVRAEAGPEGARFLLMNRREELSEALRDLRNGTFVKETQPILEE